MTISIGGCRPSPPDTRDLHFALVRAKMRALRIDREQIKSDGPGWDLSERADPRLSAARTEKLGLSTSIPLPRPNRDQVGQSCVANMACRMVEALSDIEGLATRAPPGPVNGPPLRSGPIPNLSASSLQWMTCQLTGEETLNQGTYPRNAFKILNTKGCCRQETWPDLEETITMRPSIQAFVDSEDGKLGKYYRIDVENSKMTLDDIDDAVHALHPVGLGVRVGREMLEYDGDPDRVLEYPARDEGGHALLIVDAVGPRDDYSRKFLALTPWGRFGIEGRGLMWLSSQYVRTAHDIWVGTRSGF